MSGPKFVTWDEAGGEFTGGNGGGTQFLKLSAGNKYKVRLISRPIRYLQHWEPVICRSPGFDPETNKPLDPLIASGNTPKKRYSIWVLDRNDGGRIKLMDFPPSLYDQFRNWKQATGEEPGGKNGCDWQIELKIPQGAGKMRTKYVATALTAAPFTEDEMKLIRGEDLKAKLEELRKAHTPEEIKAMIANKQGASGPAQDTAKTTTKTSYSSGDNFNDDDPAF